MSWVKLDDGFADHPKVLNAGPTAAWLYIEGLCYAARYLTDGAILDSSLGGLGQLTRGRARKLADRLVEVGLWEKNGAGYSIHDYLEYNPSRAQVLDDRQIARRRTAMNNDPDLTKTVKARDKDKCRYCGKRVNWRDRRSPTGGTYDHVLPVSQGGAEDSENIVVACRKCNLIKGARTPEESGIQLLPAPN